MPQPKAKRSVFAALACAAALAVGLLCLLVGRALTAPRTIRLEDYAEPVPEAFRMKADITQKDGMLSVDGYACIEGERFEHIDTFVALYPGTGGTALRLPTKMVLSEEAYVAGGSLAIGQLGGFTARIREQALPAGEYSVYIAYRTDGHNILAATGRALCAASLLLLAYAANMEQALVVYTGCLAGVLLWHAAARRRVHWVVWAQLAVCAANALYAATCPGTAARIAGETTSWFTDFGMRTIWQNAELGISNAMYHVLYQKNTLFFAFCVVLALAVAARHRAWYVRLFGVLPAVAVAVLGVGGPLANKLVPSLSFFANVFTKDGYLNLLTVYSPKYWLAFLLLCAVLAACVLNLYLALGHTRAAFGAMLLFCAGFASYAMLGFSPTVMVSGQRTGFFLLMSVVVCTLLLWRSLAAARAKRACRAVLCVCTACAVWSAIGLAAALEQQWA